MTVKIILEDITKTLPEIASKFLFISLRRKLDI